MEFSVSFRLLVLEDNALLLETLEDFLDSCGYEVALFKDGLQALEACYKQSFDLYLLDINVPSLNGLAFLKELRESGDKTPAMFITSSADKPTLSKGFAYGADDYIKKPFDLDELSFRIQAVLSRSTTKETTLFIDEAYSLDPARKQLLHYGKEQELHLKDYELLCLLVENRGKVVTKEMIAERLWRPSESINEGAVRVYINNLKKIFGKDSITNLRGIGYRFE